MRKRTWSLILALSLCAGLLTLPTSASEAEEFELTQEWLEYVEGAERISPNSKARSLMENSARNGAARLKKAAEEANAATDLINDVVDISYSTPSVLYLKKDGTLWFSGQVSPAMATAFGLEYGAYLTPVFLMDQVAGMVLEYDGGIILKTDGTLLVWGAYLPPEYQGATAPVSLMTDIVQASIYYRHSCIIALKSDGSLWAFGRIPSDLSSDNDGFVWPAIKIADNVDQFWCPKADSSVFVLKTDGTLWQSGGILPGEEQATATQLTQIGEDIKSFSSYSELKAYVKTDGSLWTWHCPHSGGFSANRYKMLGRPFEAGENPNVPGKVMDNVRQIVVGPLHALAVKKDGSLWVWGENFFGNLGDGGRESKPVDDGTPCIEEPYWLMGNVKKVCAGSSTSFAILEDGSLYAWGSSLPHSTGVESLYNKTVEGGRGPVPCQTTPVRLGTGSGTAYPSFQQVDIDGKKVQFQCYALKDDSGNLTNYVKIRDLSLALDGSPAQFAVTWNGYINLFTQKAARPDGSENSTPFSGERPYHAARTVTAVDYSQTDLHSFVLTDDQGGGYTYYQLRDLGKALGFNVGWSADKGVYIETDKPYDLNN